MLLALDAGNTNITIGAFDGTKLTGRWRLRTIREQTADEWGILLRNLFSLSELNLQAVDGVVISSVVPAVDQPLTAMAERYFGRQPMFVNYQTDIGLTVRYDHPREVGADRLVNAAAAFHKYGGPCVSVDLGTTINFDIVSAKAEFLGGIICPGIGMSISGLFARTARLPMVDFREPEKLIGSNTVGSITSGLYFGFIGMIDGIVERLIAELGAQTKVVATGGQGGLIVQSSRFVKQFDEDLTLEGLRLIWKKRRPVIENYFNYFTEIEEHFQRARGTGLFLLSPLDWALIEAWKNAGIPLEAVLRGIDAAFEKWRSRPARARTQMVNSIAYCAQAIATEAQVIAGGAPAKKDTAPPFSLDDVRAFVGRNAAALRKAGQEDLAGSLEALDLAALYGDLEQLEQRLTAIEEKMIARLRASASDEALFEARRTLDLDLKPYRGKMSTEQLAMLEKQFLERRLLETSGLPRLSLFYL